MLYVYQSTVFFKKIKNTISIPIENWKMAQCESYVDTKDKIDVGDLRPFSTNYLMILRTLNRVLT